MKNSELPVNWKSKKPFVQWHKSSMSRYRDLLSTSSKSALLLSLLVENMNDSNAVVVSQKTLSGLMNCTTKSIRNYVRILEREKWLNVLKIGTANVYHINPECFWQEAPNKRHYAKISASVILSAEEQTQSLDDLMAANPVTQIPKANDTDNLILLDDEEPPTQGEMEYPNG